MKNLFAPGLLMILMTLMTTTTQAQVWTQIGSAKVHGQNDYDEIWVTGLKGDFSAIKLFVENEGIQFERVVVHFANGGKEAMELRDFIPAGGETRVMDLPGKDHVIRKVDFHYKSNASTKRKARVLLYGRR